MGYVYIGYHAPMGQVTFAFGAFLGQNMTLVSVFPFDASTAGQLEAFFCAGIRFHFRHLCLTVLNYFFFLGEINMVILLPSSFGSCSTFPKSSSALAKRRSKISPCSL